MNLRLVLRLLGLVLLTLSAAIGLTALGGAGLVLAGRPGEGPATEALALSAGLGLLVGALACWRCAGARQTITRRDTIVLVVLSWLLGAGLSALPYLLWAHLAGEPARHDHPFADFVNCYFEAMSGLTTTGSTVLADIEALPHCLLFWRSLTHWLGGLGIIVLFVALLSSLGISGKKLFVAESSVQLPQDVRPRIGDTARTLWLVYTGLSMAEIGLLKLAGLSWFQAACETFGSIATGGFSVRNQSIAAYHSAAVEWIVVLFMILGGVNFALYHDLLRRQWRRVWSDGELRWFLGLLLGACFLVALAMRGQPILTLAGQHLDPALTRAVRYGTFNLVSLNTDTGFATADFNLWPRQVKILIVLVTLVGGCSGSTTGGIKVFRLVGLFRIAWSRLLCAFKPAALQPVRINRQVFDNDEQMTLLMMVLLFLLALAGGTFLLRLFEPAGHRDLITCLTASVATLCTAGPGFAQVGPASNFAAFTAPAKLVMTGLMLCGRLEMLPVLALCLPRFWKPD